jgi:integrase
MMRKQLTQSVVDRLRPGPRRIERPDHLLPALRLIVQPGGARSWAVRTRIYGKSAKLTIGDARVIGIAAARERARELLLEVASGGDPRESRQKAQANTLGGVVELYLQDKRTAVRPRSYVEIERHLRKRWLPLHRRPIAEIRKGELAARLLEIKSGHGPIEANRARATLVTCFDWAIDKELIEANVAAATRRPLPKEPSRSRVLSLEELRAVWAATAAPGSYNAAVRLLMLLGARRAEVAGLCRAELDLVKGRWLLPAARAKNKLEHIVPLPRQAIATIMAQPAEQDGRLFRQLHWSWEKQKLDRRCGVADWVIHDLRRSLVTHMNDELQVQPHVVEAVINHVSGAARRGAAGVYNKAQYLPERARALQRWADYLLEAADSTVVPLPRRA